MSLVPGTRFGEYEVDALIGAGGMGDVYRATDTSLKRKVALKVLSESFVSDANRLARLQREAEVLAALSHGNVAHIYGLERSDGTTAIVMEHVEGETLAARIAQGALPPNEALNIALQIAAGLEAAHESGIVHRDLKPANIKITPNGTVKVLDFGIAKALDARAISGPQTPSLTTPAMTEAGLVLGTAAYMSPEQARGKPVDKRADIWAFGCVLYEMLAGKPAFAGEDVTTTLARVLEREPDLRALPSGTEPAVRRTIELCLQKDAKKRLHDIGDVRLALEGDLGALPTLQAAPPAPLWRRALPIAAALLIGAVLAAGYFFNQRPEPMAAQPQQSLPVSRFVITPPASAPLTDQGGYDITISPDGKRLAYFAQNTENGRLSLYVRDLDELEARQIPGTEVQGLGNMNLFFSPDGRWIGFRQGPQRGLVRVSVDGAPPLKIADDPGAFLGAAWAADDTIVFGTNEQLQRVSAGGGSPPTKLSGEPHAFASPTLLPGERAVLFGLVDGSAERVAVFDLETGEQKILVEGGQNPTYIPTGHIVFARGTTLMAVPFDAAELAVTGDPVAMLQGVRHPSAATAADYAISANGTLVYVPGSEQAPAGFSVVWVDRTGRVIGRAVEEPVETARDPRLSPDGERLVLTTGTFNGGSLWVYDLRGRPPIPLAVGGDNRGAVWSPDGTQIAFLKIDGAANGIHTTRTDGSVLSPQPLGTPLIRGMPTVWSSAGELVLSTGQAAPGGQSVLATSIADPALRDVVATDAAEFDAALSPDGRWLAYVSDRTGANEIWVKRYPDGVAVRVSRNSGFEPRWSADGRELVYLQGAAMMAVAVEMDDDFSFAAPVELFSSPFLNAPGAGVRTYDVARDGRFLMIQTSPVGSGELGSIVVVQNWIEELKQRVPSRR
jgi:eukaryotic-like serine/threonine-protein kinase